MPSGRSLFKRIQQLLDGPGALGPGDNAKVLAWNNSTQRFEMVAQSGGGTPGGSTTQVQYNNAGAFAGDAGMTYDAANDALTVAGRIVAGRYRPASNTANAVEFGDASGTAILTLDTTERQAIVTLQNGSVTMGRYITTPGLWVNRTPDNTYHFFVTHQAGHTGTTFVVFENITNTTNGVEYRFSKLRGSSQPSNGDLIARLNFNTLSESSVYGNANTITGGYRLLDFVWKSYNLAEVYAERMRLTAEGYLGIFTNAPTALLDINAVLAARASLRIRSGAVDPTSPNSGDVWYNTRLKFHRGSTTEQFATGVQATGGAATAGATWTATEQAMVQKAYDICRSFGMLT